MDLASLISLLGGAVVVVFGILSSGGNIVNDFVDIPSVIITIGGSLISTLGAVKMSDFIAGFKGITLAIKEPNIGNAADVIANIINLSNVSRKEGLLALEEATHDVEDEFLKKGVNLIVDGTDPDLVRGILETELDNIETRHKRTQNFYSIWAAAGPAWGMIGTLIGLVNMLKNLTDSASIGPNMAVALLTTLYGSLIANWICTPVEHKLKLDTEQEIMIKEITVEGLLSIQAGENPRVIEEKLKSFLAPADRGSLNDDRGGGES